MRVFNYNKEKDSASNKSLYAKAMLVGVFIAIIFLGGGKIIVWIVKAIITHWIWALMAVLVIIFLKKFLGRKKK